MNSECGCGLKKGSKRSKQNKRSKRYQHENSYPAGFLSPSACHSSGVDLDSGLRLDPGKLRRHRNRKTNITHRSGGFPPGCKPGRQNHYFEKRDPKANTGVHSKNFHISGRPSLPGGRLSLPNCIFHRQPFKLKDKRVWRSAFNFRNHPRYFPPSGRASGQFVHR